MLYGVGCALLQTLAGLSNEVLDSVPFVLDVLLECTSKLALVVFLLVVELFLPLGPGLDLSEARKPKSVLCFARLKTRLQLL